MISPLFWALFLQTSQLEGGQRDVAEALNIGAGIFALILFALSLYAWSKRKQPALLIVSLAFLLFFSSHIVQLFGEVYEFNASIQVVEAFMNFVILALFFIAIVIRPKRKPRGPLTARD